MNLYIELFGYLGSTLVVVSMLMSSVVKLRVINTAGSVISAIYALIIGSFPLALMNICLIGINLWGLYKLLMTKNHYEMVRTQAGDAFVQYFLRHYGQNIQLFFPDFAHDGHYDRVYLLLCNGQPAGIFMGTETQPGLVTVALDYTTPAYRDCSVGKFLYGSLPSQGIRQLTVTDAVDSHQAYLKKMGYQQTQQGYSKVL